MFSYRFQNLLGTTYQNGSLAFTPDGNCLLKPSGNRTQVLDLKHSRSLTLSPENRKNIKILSLSPDSKLLLSIDVEGHGLLVNFAKGSILHRMNFGSKAAGAIAGREQTSVRHAAWSPDSQFLAVSHGRLLQLWRTPRVENGWAFEKYRVMGGHRDDIRKISWSSDSRYILSAGEDNQVRLYSVYDGGKVAMKEEPGGAAAGELLGAAATGATSGSDKTRKRKRLGEKREGEEQTNMRGTGDGVQFIGRLGKLCGEKGKRTYGGFKPEVFAENRQPVRGAYFSQNKEHVFIVSKDGVVQTWRFVVDVEAEEAAANEGAAAAAGRNAIRPAGDEDFDESFDWNKHDGEQQLHGIVLAGMSAGVFALYELMPSLSLLHTLSIGNSPIDSVSLNATGEWVAIGSAAAGQMLVWEWQSETYILKQQGHHHGTSCVAFAPSGVRAGSATGSNKAMSGAVAEGQGAQLGLAQAIVATGGHDGKVKLWNTVSGFNFVTFAEHTGEVRDLVFTPQGNAVISASVDGTVRAFDLLRYRNFRTFVSPPKEKKVLGFESVAVDGGGEIVAAAAKGDTFSVLVWSIQTGQLLETLSGNEAPVSCLRFSPNPARPGELATGCWDGNLTVQDIFKRARGSTPEKLQCGASVLAVAFDPRGNNVVACSQLAGQIYFWDVEAGQVRGTVEGIRDILSARDGKAGLSAANNRGKTSKQQKYNFSLEHVNLNQHFSSICYTASGNLLLASSRNSPHVCLYSTNAYELVYRYTLTNNQSLSGLKVLLNSGKTIADGEVWADLDLSDEEDEDHERRRKRMRNNQALPGVKVGDAAKAYEEAQFHCWDCDFSMDGKNFAVATSHGLHLYAIDSGIASSDSVQTYGTALESFQPTVLTENVSIPKIIRAVADEKNLTKAFILSLALNDAKVLLAIYDRICVHQIPAIVASIGASLLPTLIHFLTCMLHPTWGSNCIEKHVTWIETVLSTHITTLMQWTAGRRELVSAASSSSGTAQGQQQVDPILLNAKVQVGEIQALLLQCLQQLTEKWSKLQGVFDKNKHALTYLSTCGKLAGGGDVRADEKL
eukprot:g12262.t1